MKQQFVQWIDMHCHLRDPGYTYKEDVQSGTAAAHAGGCYGVVAMPNTVPCIDSPQAVRDLSQRAAQAGKCRVFVSAAITKGQKGTELTDFDALHEAGAVAFTDDGRPVESAEMMRRAMEFCAKRDYLIISHSEDLALSQGGAMNAGEVARRLGLRGIPDSAESVAVAREVILAAETGCRVHIAHVSTKASLETIRTAKRLGARVSCETCPHYFVFTDSDVPRLGPNGKMNPPLRSEADRAAVTEALADGTIDCISTDHAPHAAWEKADLATALNGITGVETAFSVAYTYLVRSGILTLEQLHRCMTANPAAILGIAEPNDVFTFDPDAAYTVNAEDLHSKSKNTPYLGMVLYGKPIVDPSCTA